MTSLWQRAWSTRQQHPASRYAEFTFNPPPRGGGPTGWPHTAQTGKPDCRGPEAKPHQRNNHHLHPALSTSPYADNTLCVAAAVTAAAASAAAQHRTLAVRCHWCAAALFLALALPQVCTFLGCSFCLLFETVTLILSLPLRLRTPCCYACRTSSVRCR